MFEFNTKRPRNTRSAATAALIAASLAIGAWGEARADEGGVSFWLPGQYGSLAALPGQPGWTMNIVYYHWSGSADGSLATSRQFHIGQFNPTLDARISGNLDARANLLLINPKYIFAEPVLGGQFAVGVTGLVGRTSTSVDGTVSASLGGPGVTRPFFDSDAVTGVGDLYPRATLTWNQGVHNYMVYGTADLPVGDYDPNRLSNIGIGHWAADAGAGYTYFNPLSGHEFSVVSGLTYNFKNPSTNYQNGVDWHLDWGASQFLSKQVHIGLVGYAYQQLTADSGQPAVLGPFKSRVFAAGPQIGYIFPIGDHQGYLNLKGYKEFGAENRPEGWNAWLTFSISPAAAPPPPPTTSSLIHK